MSPRPTGEKRSLQARQMWLTSEGKTRAVALTGETAREMEERVRGWLGIGRAKKYRTLWASSEESELEKVGSGDSSVEEIVGKTAQEAQLATQAMEEGRVLDKLMETMAVMGKEEREKAMNLYEASMPEELGIEIRKTGIERMVEERAKKIEKRREVELIKDISMRRVDWRMFSTSESMRDGGSLRST